MASEEIKPMRSRKGDLFLHLRTDEGQIKLHMPKAQRTKRTNDLFGDISAGLTISLRTYFAAASAEKPDV